MPYNGVVQRKLALLNAQVMKLQESLAEQPYVDIVRFRNLIVHQYEGIDPAILFDLAKGRLGDFRRFRDEIDALE